jgi:hypothetical protein
MALPTNVFGVLSRHQATHIARHIPHTPLLRTDHSVAVFLILQHIGIVQMTGVREQRSINGTQLPTFIMQSTRIGCRALGAPFTLVESDKRRRLTDSQQRATDHH